MRFLLLALLPILSAHASQNTWVSITPDRFNLLYMEGEQAVIALRQENAPSDPAFGLKTTVELVGVSAPRAVMFEGNQGYFVSPVLAAGKPALRVVTSLTGPSIAPNPPFEAVVQDELLKLEVQPLDL